MTEPPPVFPRTVFHTRSKQAEGKEDRCLHTQEPTALEDSQSSHMNRSQSLFSRKPLPPLPSSYSEPLYNNVEDLGNDGMDGSVKESETTYAGGRPFYYKKPLPPLPRGTPVSEPLYEDLDLLSYSHNDPKVSETAFSTPVRLPPPVPPKPIIPLQIPVSVPITTLNPYNDFNSLSAGAIMNVQPSMTAGHNRPRLSPLLPPQRQNKQDDPSKLSDSVPECDQNPIYLEILPDIENDDLTEWWHTVEPWKDTFPGTGCSEEEDRKIFGMKVNQIQMGIKFFNCCLNKHSEALQSHITELNKIADKIVKSSKKVKIGAIAGGTTGAFGSIATVAGIVLAPLTMGVSLAVTAVGVGAIAAGGVTGATTAITNKKSNNSRKKKIKEIVLDYKAEVLDIDQSLEFIVSGVKELEKHDISQLKHEEEPIVAKLVMHNASSIQAAARSTNILQRFIQDVDNSPSEEDSTHPKKDISAQLAKDVRELAQSLQQGLDHLITIQKILA